jgi:hypothetical protein
MTAAGFYPDLKLHINDGLFISGNFYVNVCIHLPVTGEDIPTVSMPVLLTWKIVFATVLFAPDKAPQGTSYIS